MHIEFGRKSANICLTENDLAEITKAAASENTSVRDYISHWLIELPRQLRGDAVFITSLTGDDMKVRLTPNAPVDIRVAMAELVKENHLPGHRHASDDNTPWGV
jgi:hypothetical protein